jgi:hypothetical protein
MPSDTELRRLTKVSEHLARFGLFGSEVCMNMLQLASYVSRRRWRAGH